jgi:hypothetical protein
LSGKTLVLQLVLVVVRGWEGGGDFCKTSIEKPDIVVHPAHTRVPHGIDRAAGVWRAEGESPVLHGG